MKAKERYKSELNEDIPVGIERKINDVMPSESSFVFMIRKFWIQRCLMIECRMELIINLIFQI